jgi:hypothetical protein
VSAYLSGTFTAGIGLVGRVTNGCERGSAIANARMEKAAITTSPRILKF